MTYMEFAIPFAGFYNSWHDQELEDIITQVLDHEGTGDCDSELHTKAWDSIDWTKAHNEYAKLYAGYFAHEAGFKTFEFKEMTSPREYNFTTDRIWGVMYLSELDKLFMKVDKEVLKETIIENHSSRPGFSSFYTTDIDEWKSKDISEWDCWEVTTLIQACIKSGATGLDSDWLDESINEYYLMEYASGNGETWEIMYSASKDDVLGKCSDIAREAYEKKESA